MKTRHLLFSMVLGAVAVGCSENELATVNGGNVADAKLSIRPVVDTKIVLGSDAETRFEIGAVARPVWSKSDKVGAAIIDVPTYTSESDYANELKTKKAIELYTIQESYGCNNAFSTEDGGETWEAEHPMVEGNYLFYAPYKENMNVRTPLTVAVPKLQDASSAKSALDEFYKSGEVVQVGYKFITGDEKEKPSSIKMFNIFAYPKFTISNNFDGYLFDTSVANGVAAASYSGKIKVDSIQFVNVGNSRAAISTTVIGGMLKHAKATTETGETATEGVVGKMKDKGDWNNVDKMLSEAVTKDLLASANTVVTNRDNMSGVITTLKVGQEIEKGKSIDLYCVMPAIKFNFDDNQLMAKVFVTVNNVEYVIYEGKFASMSDETWNTSDVKLSENAKEGKLFGANGNTGLSSLSFMAGQSYPSEALRVDANGNYQKKTGVNNLLEINLIGGKAQKGKQSDVQIAVRKNAADGGIATTAALISMIENAANGTAWKEGQDATDGATKGFVLAAKNTVEINSALIDALAKNNQNGGSFKLMTSVLPVANDVMLGSLGTTAGSKFAEFTSAKGNTAKIDLADAVVGGNRYILVGSGETSATSDANTVILIGEGKSLTLADNLTAKSVVVAPAITDGATAGVFSVANNDVTVKNINNYGNVTVKNVKAEDVFNKYEMSVSGAISAPAQKTIALTNNGKITTGAADASFTVTAGTGIIILPAATASSAALVGENATQEVIYQAAAATETDIATAAAIPAVTTLEATTSITLAAKADVARFGAIKKIIAKGTITCAIAEEIDLTGFTLQLSGDVTWTGSNVNQSIVKGLTVNSDENKLTLTNVSMTGATLTNAKVGGGVIANGTTAKWNGGASKAKE